RAPQPVGAGDDGEILLEPRRRLIPTGRLARGRGRLRRITRRPLLPELPDLQFVDQRSAGHAADDAAAPGAGVRRLRAHAASSTFYRSGRLSRRTGAPERRGGDRGATVYERLEVLPLPRPANLSHGGACRAQPTADGLLWR